MAFSATAVADLSVNYQYAGTGEKTCMSVTCVYH